MASSSTKRFGLGSMRNAIAPAVFVALGAVLAAASCRHRQKEAAADEPFTRPASIRVAETIYAQGYKPGWQNWGWSKHDDLPNGPARIDLSGWGGWILAHPGLTGPWGALVFKFKPPAGFGDALVVHLVGTDQSDLPHVRVTGPYTKSAPDGWVDVYVPMLRLNPKGIEVDRVIFSTARGVAPGWTEFDSIGLTEPVPGMPTSVAAPTRDTSMQVQCSGPGVAINAMIYGIAFNPMNDAKDAHLWQLGATARRWGGNPASRYNWQIGHAWNTANDWFFENVNYTSNPNYSYRLFLQDNLQRGVKTALTVPLLGWVAKDTSSVSFPRSANPDQETFDNWRPEAGNGKTKGGGMVPAGPPTRTSIQSNPEFIRRWIEAIRLEDKQRGTRSVHQYILDNEPALWNSTHRDVHPDPLTYDELLDKTIEYGTVVRQADPDAVIAGPAEWGWPNYFFSAKDMAVGHLIKPDRRAHGDVPLIPYYLNKLREHEAKTGVRILDVLDLHFYPQANGVHSGEASRETAALRLRQTRGLWDPTYRDESWIADQVRLLPRMKEWIDQYYPGRGISIGEWNFGAEQHISGALAVAEALGRFGQHGVTSAFYWSYPPANSPAFWAFRAYRNYDGHGGRFEDVSVPTKTTADISLFASRSTAGNHWVLVALNMNADSNARAKIELPGCAAPTQIVAYAYAGGSTGFSAGKVISSDASSITVELAPYSVNVIGFQNGPPSAPSAPR